MLRVIFPSGRLAYHCPSSEAREIVRAGLGELIGNSKRAHTVRLYDGPSRPIAGTRYSHLAESKDNPPRVWALRAITHLPRSDFERVLLDRIRSA